MKESIQLLKNLVMSFAISGYEWELGVAKTIQDMAQREFIRIGDNLVYSCGTGEKNILISAHMDEVGFFISSIQKDYVQIMPIGDIEIADVIGKKLTFVCNGTSRTSYPIKSYKTFNELKVFGIQKPSVGDVGTFEKVFSVRSDKVYATSLDNKVGCLALLLLMKEVYSMQLDSNVYICFSSREEVGVNGVMQVAQKINPDICIDVDSAYAKPVERKNNWAIPEVGQGPAIQLMGTDFIIRSENRKISERAAKKNNLPIQYEIPASTSGGTNASSLTKAGYDVIQINIPVAKQHASESVASIDDILDTTKLLKAVLQELN